LSAGWIQKWDERYRNGQHLFDQPAPLVTRFTPELVPGSALDLACGPGRHALYLADRGWRVTAVDGSPVAIDILRARASERNLSIDLSLADLEADEFQIEQSRYELVLSCRYFQRSLIPGIKLALRPAGVVIVIAHLADSGEPRNNSIFADPGELRALFEGWRILHYREGGPDESGHRHGVAEMVARKPD
jgi:tellurite methyltransferase